mgnify:CR=1 FL=1
MHVHRYMCVSNRDKFNRARKSWLKPENVLVFVKDGLSLNIKQNTYSSVLHNHVVL